MAQYSAPALDKGLDILEFLSIQAIPQSQVEISKGVNRSSNEIYRMLLCLEERDYVQRDLKSGKYNLSLKLYQLAHRHSPVDGLKKAAYSPMEQLSAYSRESCHLSTLYRNKLLVVAHSRSPDPVALSIEEGGLFHLSKTTSGRVILSFLNEEEILEVLKHDKYFDKMSSAQRKQYLSTIVTIRNDGYDIRESETTFGVTNIAVPVGRKDSGIMASLTFSIFTAQQNKSVTFDVLVEQARKTATKINRELGVASEA